MPDSFVPLAPLASLSKDNAFSAFQLKILSTGESKPAFPPANGHAPAVPGEPCDQPTVLLQRTGETVTSIRIQCTCGKVIELNCTY
jgi:hypothetical protein